MAQDLLELLQTIEPREENTPMQALISLALPEDLADAAAASKRAKIERAVAESVEASWQLELWEHILAEQAQPASKPLTSLAFESATPLAQYCHVLHELLNSVPKEVLDTELFFYRTKHLVVIALISSHRLQPASLEVALANMLSSRYAPDYACLAVQNDSSLFEPVLSAIVQKAAAEDAASSNVVLRAGLSQALLQLAELMPGYSDTIRDRLLSAEVLSNVWWTLVKQLEPEQVLASLCQTLEKCEKSIRTWWFATADETFFTDLWGCLVGFAQQRGRRNGPNTQRQLLQCFAAVLLCAQPGEERRSTMVSLMGPLAEGCVDGATTRAYVALCILVTGLIVGTSGAQAVGHHFTEALKRSKLCQIYVVACLVYSRTDDLKAFAQRALRLPEFVLSPAALQALQKQHTQHVSPNGLMRELQQALAEAPRQHEAQDGRPYPGDEIDCVLLFLQLRLFLDTRTDPHDIVLGCIRTATCPPHPKLLDCLQAWIACVVRSWEQPRGPGASCARQFFRPVLPDEATAAFHATSWALANKHRLVPFLSKQHLAAESASAAAASSWHSLVTAYGLDPTCTDDFARHECQEFARALKSSRDEEDGRPVCQPHDEVFQCFDRRVWASISCVYATLLLRSALAESAFAGMFPFELELSELPIRRALQVLSIVAQLCPAAVEWLQAMLRQVAAHCPQHLCAERCFLLDPLRALQHLPDAAAHGGQKSGTQQPQHDEQFDWHELFLATLDSADHHASRFLERTCQPAIRAALRGEGFIETAHVAQQWVAYHVLHPQPDQFELETFNLFLRVCELPHLHAIPSHDLLAREPCVLFRLPLPLLMRPWALRILFVILRSSMEKATSDATFVLRRQKTAFESLPEAARVRSKLTMIEQLPAELFVALTDSVLIRCLTELAFCVQENVQLLGNRNGAEYFALFESHQLVLGALRFYLCIRPELPELLLAQSLAWEHARLLFRISPDMRRAAGVVLAAVQNMSQQEHPEEVLYQADAVLLYHDEAKLVERLCATLSSILVSVVTDILPHYCRQQALQEAIVGVFDTLAARAPLQLLRLRERLSTPILACLPRRVSANLHSELDRLCGEIRAGVLKLAPSDTDEAAETANHANGTEQQSARKRQRS